MNVAQPIRDLDQVQLLKDYFEKAKPNKRNRLLIILGLNTALRISDILSLKWEDVYNEKRQEYHKHIMTREHKTSKNSNIYINENLKDALEEYRLSLLEKGTSVSDLMTKYIFLGQKSAVKPFSRVQAHRIVTDATEKARINQKVSCHSLRKTFGYHAWKQGIEPALLTNIFNHSSYKVTTRYLGIDQDDKDEVFRKIDL